MGRKRIDPEEKKVVITVSLKKKYADRLKERKVNISNLFESFIKKYLNL